MIKLPNQFAALAREWIQAKSDLNKLEKRKKELDGQLKAAIQIAHGKHRINDMTHPCQVDGLSLHLEPVAAVFGAEITQAQVGTTPLIRREYVMLKANPV